MKNISLHLLLALIFLNPNNSYSEVVDLKIAVVVPLQSNISNIAREIINGSQLSAFNNKEINPWKSLERTNIDLVFWDDMAHKDKAISVADQVIAKPFNVVVGSFNSGTAIPTSAKYEAAKILNITTGATNPLLTSQNHKYVFRSVPDDFSLPADLMSYLDGLKNAGSIFAVHDKTAYGEYVVKGALSRLATSEKFDTNKILSSETAESVDFSKIKEVKAGAENNFIILGSMGGFAAAFIDRLPKDRNWVILGADGVLAESLLTKTKNLPNIKIIGVNSVIVHPVTPSSSIFTRSYLEKFGVMPTQYAAKAYDVIAMLLKAFESAHTSDSTALAIQLRTMGVYQGLMGPISFDESGNNTSRIGFVYEISNGEMAFKDVVLNGEPYHKLPFLVSN